MGLIEAPEMDAVYVRPHREEDSNMIALESNHSWRRVYEYQE